MAKVKIFHPIQEIIPGINLGEVNPPVPSSGFPCVICFADGLVHDLEAIEAAGVHSGFNNQVVVDLGAGEYVFTYGIVASRGARAYVANDFHHETGIEAFRKGLDLRAYNIGLKKNFPNSSSLRVRKPIPTAARREDMLSFLCRLPSDSVSILLSGIDSNILTEDPFVEALGVEMTRVLNPRGALLAYCSKVITPKLKCEFQGIHSPLGLQKYVKK